LQHLVETNQVLIKRNPV